MQNIQTSSRKSLDSNDRSEKAITASQSDKLKEKHKEYDAETVRSDCVNYFLTRFNVWDEEDLENKDEKFKTVGMLCLKAYFTNKKLTKTEIGKVNKFLNDWDKANPATKKRTLKQINKEWSGK